jgi:CheY-like chemotaxis protein
MSWQVLIVEDEEDIREGLASVLSARGYRTMTACNGNEALDLVRRRGLRPSVVVLDLAMPVMDGVGFLESQADDPFLASVPVVVVTAQPKALDFASVKAVFAKPLDLASLLSTIRRVCS